MCYELPIKPNINSFMSKTGTSLLLLILFIVIRGNSQVPSFQMPDTVCVNDVVNIQNTSVNASSYLWRFCDSPSGSSITGLSFPNSGSMNEPAYLAEAEDTNGYFAFVTNHEAGSLTRHFFGNSYMNVPVSVNLGNLGVLSDQLEGIDIKNDNGSWYAFLTGGMNNNVIIRLNFGGSLMNTPTANILGNIGGFLNYPHMISLIQENGNWYGFVANYSGNEIVRLDFGNSLATLPVATIVGNTTSLSGPVSFRIINSDGLWYLFVVNRVSNALTRLNFGNSLANAPVETNLGTITGLTGPRSIAFFQDCNSYKAIVVNESNNSLALLTFGSNLSGVPSGQNLGNIANFSFPHYISAFFNYGDSLYTFVTNILGNNLSRVAIPLCTSPWASNTTQPVPSPFSFGNPGNYTVSLTIDMGLPSQSTLCKELIVLDYPVVTVTGDTVLCGGDTLRLTATYSTDYQYSWTGPSGWSSQGEMLLIPGVTETDSGEYILTVSQWGHCPVVISVHVHVHDFVNIDLGNDTSLCMGDVLVLDGGHPGSNYLWNTGQTTQSITVNQSGDYWVHFSEGSCTGDDTISVMFYPVPHPNLGPDTVICPGEIILLSPGTGFSSYLWSDGSTGETLPVIQSGEYSVKVFNGSCSGIDYIVIDECGSEIWIPNVFTPNHDMLNNTFYAVTFNIDEITLYIYNRWGNQLFEGSGSEAVWDGTYQGVECATGVYVYLIECRLKGKHGGKRQYNGIVTLLR